MFSHSEIEKLKIQLAQITGNAQQQAVLYDRIGELYYNEDEYVESLSNFQAALQLNEQNKNPLAFARCCLSIGNIYNHQSKFPTAIEYYFKASGIFNETGHRDELARAYNNIGVIYFRQGDLARGLEYLLRALNLFKEGGYQQGIAACNENIANIYQNQDKYEEALQYYTENLALFESLDNRAGLTTCYLNIGKVYVKQNNPTLALQMVKKASHFIEEVRQIHLKIEACDLAGKAYTALRMHWQADKALAEGLLLAEKNGQKKLLERILLTYYQLKKEEGDNTKALEYFEHHAQIKDELVNIETSEKIASLRFDFEIGQKEKEKRVIEGILHNILPKSIADRIKNGEDKIIERFTNTSILFADIVGFTNWSEKRDVNEVAQMLDRLFQMFDMLAQRHGVEKIKTIGDAYMCVTGLPEPCPGHAHRLAGMALEMDKKITEAYPDGEIKLRIGIHSGEVIAGVIGKNKYAYDLWGDAVNMASRMESHSLPGKIQVSEKFKNLLDHKFRLTERGPVEIKGKGKINTWWLDAAL